jgi:selenophosphate synthetase-related protein
MRRARTACRSSADIRTRGATATGWRSPSLDLRGSYFGPYPYWNCSTSAPHDRLRADLDLLPGLAEDGLCRAAKDISMGGVLGTLLMLLECSGVGARVALDRIPRAPEAPLERWLLSFPSFGYLLAVSPGDVDAVRERFTARGIACDAIGECTGDRRVRVSLGDDERVFWDLAASPFTGVRAYAAT